MIGVIVSGCKGRMGGRIVKLIRDSDEFQLTAGIDFGDSLADVLDRGNVIIEFSTPDASAEHATIAAENDVPIIIGTTGLKAAQEKLIKKASLKVPIVYSPNMGIGTNLMFKLIETAVGILGDRYDVDIVETHHAKKLDRPSGTAKRMAENVLKMRSPAPEVTNFREAMARRKYGDKSIRICSVREGDVVGEHEIKFRCSEETISIFHRANTRDLFARGALTAAKWIVGRPPGLYGMEDVLGLR